MRALVSCDRIGHLGPARVSDAVTGAFAGRGTQVAIAPVSGGGEGLAEAPTRFSPGARVLAAENLHQACDMLAEGPDYLDITAVITPELGELLEPPVAPARAGTIMAVPHREVGRTLTGPTGSLAGRDRKTGASIAAALAEDSRAVAWLERLGATGRTSAGVLCGLGAWALDCRAWVASGIRIRADGYRLSKLVARTDVIVTGTDVLDLHRCGGDIVAGLTRLGVEALRPVIVVADRNLMSSWELRLAGIEEAHTVTPPGVGKIGIAAKQLEALAQRVVSTWTW